MYNVIGESPHSDFKYLIDEKNELAQILLGHFFVFHVLLHHIIVHELMDRESWPMQIYLRYWIQNINNGLSRDMIKYHEWPIKVVTELPLAKQPWKKLLLDRSTSN